MKYQRLRTFPVLLRLIFLFTLLLSLLSTSLSSSELDESLAVVSEDSQSHHEDRQLVKSTGTLKILVVRISARDGSPQYSNSETFDYLFSNDFSLKWQYYACSRGKLQIEPTDRQVLDVYVNINARGRSAQNAVTAAEPVAVQRLGGGISNVRDYADLTMFILPPGTTDYGSASWGGYAIIGGKASYINNDYAGVPSSVIHEIGHNLGLRHANRPEGNSLDLSGYMSRGVLADDYPYKCFNAQNHWMLGWFADKAYAVASNQNVALRVMGFVDYDKAVKGQDWVVVKVGQKHYFQFNRAKKHNRDTEEARDQLMIIRSDGSSGTTALSERSQGQQYIIDNFEGSGRAITIRVCRTVMGSTDDDVDYMEVSVSQGSNVNECGQVQVSTRRPTNAPVIPPSPRPTNAPVIPPSPRPTNAPVIPPSPRPARQPVSPLPVVEQDIPDEFERNVPTSGPSARPTPRPTRLPTLQPIAQPTKRPTPATVVIVQNGSAVVGRDVPQLILNRDQTSAPTTERYFELVNRGDNDRPTRGWVVQRPSSAIRDRVQNQWESVQEDNVETSGGICCQRFVGLYPFLGVAVAAAMLLTL